MIDFFKRVSISGVQRGQHHVGFAAIIPHISPGKQGSISNHGDGNVRNLMNTVDQSGQLRMQRRLAGAADRDKIRVQTVGDLYFQLCQDVFNRNIRFAFQCLRGVFSELTVDAVLGAGLHRGDIHAQTPPQPP